MHLLVQLAVFAFLATTVMAKDNQINQELIHPKTKAASGGQVYPFLAKCTWALLQEGVPTNQNISSCVSGNSTSPLTSGTVAYAQACWSSCLPGESPPCEGWQRGPIQPSCYCAWPNNACFPMGCVAGPLMNGCIGDSIHSCWNCMCTCAPYTVALIDAVSDIGCQ